MDYCSIVIKFSVKHSYTIPSPCGMAGAINKNRELESGE